MDDKNRQSSNPPQAQPLNEQPSTLYINSSHPKKVLQPSAELVQEVRAEQTERAAAEASQPQTSVQYPASQGVQTSAPQTPQAVSSVATSDAGRNPQTGTQPVTATSSIYPEPTKGFVGSAPTPTSPPSQAPEPSAVSSHSKRALVVKIVAVILILIDLGNAYDWYLAEQAGNDQWLTIIGIVISLVVAVGIFRRKELARILYVFASIVLLIIAGIGIIQFYATTNSSLQAHVQPISKSNLENDIATAKTNTWMTPQQKRVVLRNLQNELSAESGSKAEIDAKRYVSIALTLAVSVGPLIFLTRPSIKEVFTD